MTVLPSQDGMRWKTGIWKSGRNHALLLIDIAVPRDIDPEINSLENVYLYNVDDLQATAEACLRQRQEEVARCEAIIRQKAEELLHWEQRRESTLGA